MKKLFVTITVLFICISCFGCSGSKDTGAIKIGASGPLTGPAAAYGIAVKNAMEIAVEEINALGDLQFELDFEDDTHNAETAVNAYGVLSDWGMQISMSCVTSAPAAEVSPKLQQDNIFAITPSASSYAVVLQDINDEDSYFGNVFQMCFTDPAQGTLSAQYIKQNKLAENVAIIYKSDDNYSVGIYDTFVAEAKKQGLKIGYTGSFDNSNSTDFTVQVTQAQAAGCDLVFLPIYYDPASLIIAKAAAINYDTIFFGVDGMDGILGVAGFDTSLAEGVYLLTPFSADATDDFTAKFVAAYKAKYNEVPMQFAADGYDCIYAVYQACKAAGVKSSMSASEICDILVKQFTSMSFTGTTGTSTWNADGTVNKTPKAVIIKNGVYVGA